jgi:putative hydrolase of the HAD superfamily
MAGDGYLAVTFDIGGTLLYSDPSPAELYATHLSRLGRRVGADEVAPVFAAAWVEMQRRSAPGRDRYRSLPGGERAWWGGFVREVLARLDHDAPWERLLDELYAAFSDSRVWRTFPGALETVVELAARGLGLAVISNWDRRLPAILRGLELDTHFRVITVSSLVGVEKPAAAIFARTLAELDVPAGRALHVGDSPFEDYAGASQAGMAAALIDREDRFAGQPYRRVRSLPALLELVG